MSFTNTRQRVTTRRLQKSNQKEHKNRQDLFSNNSNNNSNNNKTKISSSSSNTTASEAQEIQKSLMKTQHLLKHELHRVGHISHAIEEDEAVLQQTMDHHQSLNTKQAQRALKALEQAQQQEQQVLMASILFFSATVFYILWSRVLFKFDVISMVLDWIV